MKLTSLAKVQNKQWRYDEATGFLRCTAVILKEGVLEYRRDELAGIPDSVTGEKIRVYVSQAELNKQASIQTLEGMPAVIGHTWQDTNTNEVSCGNIAGSPLCDGVTLTADILITESEAVRRIMLPPNDPDLLQEISSAYDAVVVWESGVSPTGEAYDGYFIDLSYNHVAILPIGNGRAGASVRIINDKRGDSMEFTKVRLRNGKSIRVANEDVEALEADVTKTTEDIKNAVTPEQLTAALEELTALKAETTEKNARIAELEGMIQSYKDQLDAALSTDTVEAKAEEMALENEEAEAVMNSIGASLDKSKKLRGTALKIAVVNAVRVSNGKSELSDDETKNADFVNGLYKGVVSITKIEPTGHKVVVNNSQQQFVDPRTAQKYRLYGKKEE